jgi:nucleoside-diphosphate-sugar epimerase
MHCAMSRFVVFRQASEFGIRIESVGLDRGITPQTTLETVMRVGIVGATGVLGRQVAPRLIERRHEVLAIVRRADEVERLRGLGYDAVLGDILDADSLVRGLAGCEAALHLATAIPRAATPNPDWSLNDRIRREGTKTLLGACRKLGIDRYVQQSIAHLVADGSTSLLDESAPAQPDPLAASAADMERLVRDAGLRWTILRGGAFYGPHTGRDEVWRSEARAGRLRMPGDGKGYISLANVTDMADAIVLATEIAPTREVLAIVDDEPVTYTELFTYLAHLEEGPQPQPNGPASPWPSFRVSNARARAVLGWQPRLPTYRSGFT